MEVFGAVFGSNQANKIEEGKAIPMREVEKKLGLGLK